MSQSKLTSLAESALNTFVGWSVSVIARIWIYPAFGFDLDIVSNMGVTTSFVVISLARSYIIRRVFNRSTK